MWFENEAILAFEWILLVTLLVIGMIGDIAQAMLALDQSYTVLHPLIVEVHGTEQGATNSGCVDAAVCSKIATGTTIPTARLAIRF